MFIDNNKFEVSPKFAVMDNPMVISKHLVLLTENLQDLLVSTTSAEIEKKIF